MTGSVEEGVGGVTGSFGKSVGVVPEGIGGSGSLVGVSGAWGSVGVASSLGSFFMSCII